MITLYWTVLIMVSLTTIALSVANYSNCSDGDVRLVGGATL